ncbi:MAG TPA: lytic transglycosylase domain-containing protein [Candidatus Acidoferrum sp.]|nr:lytic transglycosylase domain-containing protein [Candidatus Acidoferrum sp.]
MFQGVALAGLIAQCAPSVAASTMAAIVPVESGGNPFAIDDDTTRRSYYPRDRRNAEVLANRLIEAGHVLDLGIAQVDSANFAHLGINVHTAFDACTNLRAGSAILSADYVFAERRYGGGQNALRHAIGMYNTGRLDAGAAYVQQVLVVAGIREQYEAALRIDARREAMRSSVLVRVPTARRGPPGATRRVVTPARAPILITIASANRVTIF